MSLGTSSSYTSGATTFVILYFAWVHNNFFLSCGVVTLRKRPVQLELQSEVTAMGKTWKRQWLLRYLSTHLRRHCCQCLKGEGGGGAIRDNHREPGGGVPCRRRGV